jgi:hypothetical protein
MSTVSQTIPNLLSGLSQQPDNRKRPGQLNEAYNCYPDFALGMLKRPGSQHVARLIGATDKGKFFPVLRDENEKYIAQYDTTNNQFRVWDLLTGKHNVVNMPLNAGKQVSLASYNSTNSSTMQTECGELNTAIDDLADKLATLQTIERSLAQATENDKVRNVRFFEIDTNYQDEINQVIKSGTLLDEDGVYTHFRTGAQYLRPARHLEILNAGSGFSSGTFTANLANVGDTNPTTVGSVQGTVVGGEITLTSITSGGEGYKDGDLVSLAGYAGTLLRVRGWHISTERTDEYPALAAEGFRLFEAIEYLAPSSGFASGVSTASSAYITAKANYDTAAGVLQQKRLDFLAQVAVEAPGTTMPTATYTVVNGGSGLGTGPLQLLNQSTINVVRADGTTGSGSGMKINLVIEGGEIKWVGMYDSGSGYNVGDRIRPNLSGATDVVIEIGRRPYLEGATADDLEFLTLNDSIFVLNKKRKVEMTADKTHANFDEYRAHVLVQTVINNTKYKVNLTGGTGTNALTQIYEVTSDTSAATADDVATKLTNAINEQLAIANAGSGLSNGSPTAVATSGGGGSGLTVDLVISGGKVTSAKINNAGSGYTYGADISVTGYSGVVLRTYNYTATQVGPGLYITASGGPLAIEVVGGTTGSALFALSETIANTSLLPLATKNGYIVRVVNSEEINIDDMWLQFKTDSGADFGIGNWEETTKPGLFYKFDPLTMPHRLINDGIKFDFASIDWDEMGVGDENTNPLPSFVTSTLSHMFFYRNRLGFLSGQNVILSKAADLFDFWVTSAQTSTADDPIDISVAGKKPVFLNYATATSTGLVLYSTVEQFLLSTDADILSPTTAKVNVLSGYECDDKVEAVSIGTSQTFISKSPQYTRLFELTDINADSPPLVAEISNIVPEFIPATISSLIASPTLSMVSLGQIGGRKLYQYRFLDVARERRAVNSWYQWEMNGALLSQFFDTNTLYAVCEIGSQSGNAESIVVQSFDMGQNNEQGVLKLEVNSFPGNTVLDAGRTINTDVCIDNFIIDPHRVYNIGTDTTYVYVPYATPFQSSLYPLVVINGGPNFNGYSIESITEAVVSMSGATNFDGGRVELPGDLRGAKLICGFKYDMRIELPTIYRYTDTGEDVRNDIASSLMIHRIKFKHGVSGPVNYRIFATGSPMRTMTISPATAGDYEANNIAFTPESVHTVPLYQRNENLRIQIIGDSPFPVSLLGLDWEGKLNQRFYRRG